MAELNKETKATLGAAADKIGTYKESTGGGDPVHKGEKFKVADTPEEAEKMREADPDTKVRVNQPRNPDGTFGYNSQNARGLKYGPSRGTTVPDFLRGVDLAFLEKGSTMVMQGEKGIEYYLSTIDMTKEQLIENCKHYIESREGFAGMHEGMMAKKKGRHSKEEIARGQQLQEYREDKDKMSKKAFGTKYRGKVPSGIVSDKKVDISKLAQKTQGEITKAQDRYKSIENWLSGIDAGELGRGTWGVTNFNKAGVSEEQLKDRADWRETKAQQVAASKRKPKFDFDIIHNAIQNKENEDSVSSNKEKTQETKSTGVGDSIDISSIRDILKENGIEEFDDLTDDEIRELFNDGTLTPDMFGIEEDNEEIAKSMGLDKEEVMA